MATRKVDTKFTIYGEQAYRQALSQINGGLKVLNSEMKLVTEQYASNADSAEALTAKQDVLSRQISSQKEKIETLRAALQDSVKVFGESDTRTMRWQTSLNNAEANLARLNNQLDKNEQALKDATKAEKANETATENAGSALGTLKGKFSDLAGESRGFGDIIGDIGNKLGVNLPTGATTALNGLGSLNPAVVAGAAGFSALAAAIVKVEKALMDMTLQSAVSADNILTLSAQTGLSTKSLQEFQYATELLDVSMDTLQGSMTKLTNNMQVAATTGTGDAAQAFINLGVSITNVDGSLRDAETVFYEAIDALGAVNNVTERDALAMDIFGRSAQDLNPLIIQGSEALAEFAAEAENAGYVMDEKMLASLGAVDDAQQRLLKTQEAVTNQISAEYAPYMEESLTDTADFIKKIGDAFRSSGIVDSFGSILTSASSLLEPLGDLAGTVLPALNAALEPIAYTIALIADTVTVLHGIITLDVDKIRTGLGLNASYGQLSAQQKIYYGDALKTQRYDPITGRWTSNYGGGYVEAGTGKWVPYNATGTSNFPGGMTWVGENGPEKVFLPRGSQIYNNQESRDSGGAVYNFYLIPTNIKELNDLVRIAQDGRRTKRMEGR